MAELSNERSAPEPWRRVDEELAFSTDRLNLGSGRDYLPGWWNVDVTDRTRPDLVHDLDEIPWPLPDHHFRQVKMFDVLEHLKEPFRVLEEVHRICADGATVEIVVPHFSSANAYTDITHRSLFGFYSLDTVTGEHTHDYYTAIRYRLKHRHIEFHKHPPDRLVARFANRYPLLYEQRLAWMWPAWFVVFELEVIQVTLSVGE